MLKGDVVSLEVAKELQENGVELEAEFWWIGDDEIKVFLGEVSETLKTIGSPFDGLEQEEYKCCIPTYTLDQMLRELPEWIEKNEVDRYARTLVPGGICYSRHPYKQKAETLISFGIISTFNLAKTNPATACAKLILWCKENGYVK